MGIIFWLILTIFWYPDHFCFITKLLKRNQPSRVRIVVSWGNVLPAPVGTAEKYLCYLRMKFINLVIPSKTCFPCLSNDMASSWWSRRCEGTGCRSHTFDHSCKISVLSIIFYAFWNYLNTSYLQFYILFQMRGTTLICHASCWVPLPEPTSSVHRVSLLIIPYIVVSLKIYDVPWYTGPTPCCTFSKTC